MLSARVLLAGACVAVLAVALLLAMLLGFLDEDDYPSDDDLPVARQVDSVWEPGRQRNSVASACSQRLPNLVGLDESANPAPPPQRPQVDYSAMGPAERLLRMALLVNSPQDYVERPTRKRRRLKQRPSLGEQLAALIADPAGDPAPWTTYVGRRLGYHEFERRFAADLGFSIRAAREPAKKLWSAADRGVQNGWTVLAQVGQHMYDKVNSRTRVLKAPPGDSETKVVDGTIPEAVSLCCLGLLCTWILDLGLDDLGVMLKVRNGLQGEALLQALKNVPLYEQAFQSFYEWIVHRSDSLGFRTHAGSMEMCMQGTPAHRVHVHAFMGPQLDMMAWQSSQHTVSVDLATLAWGGARPNVRLMRCRRQGRAVRDEIVGGMYYVLMNKPGSMFRMGNRWPFTELLAGSNRCVILIFSRLPRWSRDIHGSCDVGAFRIVNADTEAGCFCS